MKAGRLIAVAGAALLLAAMFGDWYAFDITGATLGGDTTVNAWQAFAWIDLVMVLAIVAAIAAVFLHSAIPVLGDPRFGAGAGALTAALIVYRIADTPVKAGSTGFATVDISVRAGLFLGLAGALMIAVGGVLTLVKRT